MSFVVTRKSQTKEVSIIPEYRGYERIGHILSSQDQRHPGAYLANNLTH